MANIIQHQTIQVNFTLVPKTKINLGLLSTDALERKMEEIYGDSSKPILTKFPDVFVLFDPKNQVTINILSDQNRVIISDNRVTSFSGRNLNDFIQFAKGAADIILKNEDRITAYGFNILTIADLDVDDTAKFMLNKFIKQDFNDEEIEFLGGGVRLIFQDNDHRNDLRLNPHWKLNLSATKSIEINQNSHFVSTSLPVLTELDSKIKNIYSNLPIFLGKIF